MSNHKELQKEIFQYLSWRVSPTVLEDIDTEELALQLERKGFCEDPYMGYEKALSCPLNIRNEDCYDPHCKNFKFCRLLNQEGYSKK